MLNIFRQTLSKDYPTTLADFALASAEASTTGYFIGTASLLKPKNKLNSTANCKKDQNGKMLLRLIILEDLPARLKFAILIFL